MTSQIAAEQAGSTMSWDVDGQAAPGVILICEHASNASLAPWDISDPALLASHAASDPGALGLAQALAAALAPAHGGAELVHAPLSRLIYDLNRSPDRADACPVQSELHHVALNKDLSPSDRLARMEALYLPFHNHVRARIARALALGRRPVVVTVHSFSPTWHGLPRSVEFGVIHDDLPALARNIVAAAADLGLQTELNAPYSAADHVTHTLRLHALPYGLDNAMLEIRNDLIATPQMQQDMAQRLAPVLTRAIAQTQEVPCPAL
jgi:predicted N-formylglutamate amidohydrolase